MARRNLQNSFALEWSLVSLLQACIDVVLAVLILACALIHFLTLRIIRASGSYVPCVLCSAHVQQGEKERGFVAEDPSLIRSRSVVPLRDKEISGNFCSGASAECSTALIPVEYRHGEVIEMSMEDSCEGTESESPSSSINCATSGLEDRKALESADRKQQLKGKELKEALQAEREALAALYVELDQERNSSATAASEALAMISRLQEEKAALQLEARQFQRMVMENVLYDQEAIEVLQDIIVNHEEEKIALEDEVRVCREKLDSLLLMEGERGEVERHTLRFQEMVAERRRNVQISEAEMMIETVKIGPRAKVVNEDQSGSRYLERIDKANSQILTSEFSLGGHEPFSSHLVESPVFDTATCNPNLKTSLKDSVVSNEKDENENAPLLHSLQTGRENGSQDLVGNEGNQIGELGIREDGKPEDTKFISLKRSWSSRGSQESALNTLDKDREDRCIEEKRISMLECVWKLEGQLQQHVGGPSIQVTWPKSAEESSSKTQSPSQGDSISMRSKKHDTSVQEITRDDSLRRRLFAEGDCMEQGWVEMPHSEGAEVTNGSRFTGVSDGRLDDDGSCRISMDCSQDRPNEAEYVQDVYEVKNSMYEGPVVFMEGVGNSYDSSVAEMYQPISERLRKADFVNLDEKDPRNRAEQELDCPSQTTILAQDVDCVTEREATEGRVQYKDLHMLSLPRRRDINTLMEEEVKQLTILLKVLENDKYVMKQTIDTLRRENEEMKLPQEVSQQLYELCGMEEKEMRLKYSVPLTLQSQVLKQCLSIGKHDQLFVSARHTLISVQYLFDFSFLHLVVIVKMNTVSKSCKFI